LAGDSALSSSHIPLPARSLFVIGSLTGTKRSRVLLAAVLLALGLSPVAYIAFRPTAPQPSGTVAPPERAPDLKYQPRKHGADPGGYETVSAQLRSWPKTTTLDEIATRRTELPARLLGQFDQQLTDPFLLPGEWLPLSLSRAMVLNYEGRSQRAYEHLAQTRVRVEADRVLAEEWLYTVIFFQGMTALRRGEDENCLMCRGECSCIIPLAPSAVHTNPIGSQLAVRHFTEYLDRFPDDLTVKWLLNIAHMTLGEYPAKVDSRYLVALDKFNRSEFDIGRFRDVGPLVGIDRLNWQGGGIMDDFDNDDRLDIVTTSNGPRESMTFYRNKGDGTFEDRSKEAGFAGLYGGLFAVQADYNNDGRVDIFVPRGAWTPGPMRPSLLRNNGNGSFTDVTTEAGLDAPHNSLSACWADYDNDGFIDLFVPCGLQPSRLYRNKGDGTFEEVAARAGVAGPDRGGRIVNRSATWIDFDNDGYPDLFVNELGGTATLYRNNRNGTFTDVTKEMGIDGPVHGFSCWAFDYDNDGYLDIFATCYDYPPDDIVRGLIGQPHSSQSNRLYRNLGGKGFKDVTKEAGLDLVFATMGSNFGDFDNDGYLDFYLGAGGPDLSMLAPNRMFKNVGGKRFAEITGTSGTGHLQKGHSVACGDWDRNGTVDIFIEMGGVTNGTRYHNILFQNPGQGNNWLNVKLVGKKSNRSAIGARIKAVTAGANPQTVYRWVSSGSSFGANPLEQHLGLGKAEQVAVLEIYWPTSGTTQVFRDIPANRAIEITEFATEYRKRDYQPIPLPK
jgi:hypothetical protein